MKRLLLILACILFAFCITLAEQEQCSQYKPLKLIEQNKDDLIDINDVKEDTSYYMILQKLRESDTIVLVCFFEEIYTPHFRNTISGKKYSGLFVKDKYGRIVQVLKGNIHVGETFVLRESYSEMPVNYPFSRDDIMTGKATQPVSYPLKGEMSYVVFQIGNSQRVNDTIVHENHFVDSEFRCSPNFHVPLSRFLHVKPATIDQQAF